MNTLYEIIGCLNGSLSRGSCQRAGFGKNPAAMTNEVEIMCLIFPNRYEHAVSHLILPIWGDIPERGKSASFKICFTQRELVTAVLFHRGKARSLFYPPARLKTGWLHRVGFIGGNGLFKPSHVVPLPILKAGTEISA